jgi:nitroreductase
VTEPDTVRGAVLAESGPESDLEAMGVFDAIYALRATRVYEDREIHPDLLGRVLDAGTRACSSGNTQPWDFVVVTEP